MIQTYSPTQLRMLVVSLVVISACEIFFILDVLEDVFGFGMPVLRWFEHTTIEIFVTIALGFSISTIIHNIRSLLLHQRSIEESVQIASGDLHKVISEYFKQWKLTPSEQEVALLLFKGFSTQEIADLRKTKLGTVKNQSSSIYQKAEVKNRNELFALFVEELLGDSIQGDAKSA